MFSRINRLTKALVFIAVSTGLATPVLGAQSGGIEGTITWQYNDYVGTKGDVGAKVLLFPQKLKHKIRVGDQNLITEIGSGIVGPDGSALGLRSTSADGYGKAILDDVAPGDYVVLIISNKTTRDIEKPVDEDEVAELEPYFESKAALAKLSDGPFLKLNKFWIESVTVRSGQVTHFSHDFGNTYI